MSEGKGTSDGHRNVHKFQVWVRIALQAYVHGFKPCTGTKEGLWVRFHFAKTEKSIWFVKCMRSKFKYENTSDGHHLVYAERGRSGASARADWAVRFTV